MNSLNVEFNLPRQKFLDPGSKENPYDIDLQITLKPSENHRREDLTGGDGTGACMTELKYTCTCDPKK